MKSSSDIHKKGYYLKAAVASAVRFHGVIPLAERNSLFVLGSGSFPFVESRLT